MAPPRPLILVVEDEALVALHLATCLRQMGYDTVTAPNGIQALVRLAERAFQAIVTDLRMPLMDGRALVRRLREGGCDIPILVVTGVPEDAEGLPVSRVLPKPIDEVLLSRALAAHVGGAPTRS